MSYQVLARKWRPKNFQQLMGQEHVVTVLVNALEQQRLHHAYLFTGTRGVGKTTIARIFAKSLNCEQGITATPCGKCDACTDIDQGRFVDLLEIDAASRTKVDDTREILDNVQYAPTRGRYKVYLIDEVHMLSRSSFNALLKTLEEPPEHVKFILATTDPQKLPITVLSRCLQFHLKALTVNQIEQQLNVILSAEEVTAQAGALTLLAKAARGSMRDSLSLTDQAIAQGQGNIVVENVQQMLGGIDQNWLYKILIALIKNDANELMKLSLTIASYAPNYSRLLAELIQLLHQIAMTQVVGQYFDLLPEHKQLMSKFCQALSPEDVQLYYQIALNGRKDLPYACDEQAAFDMVLLRLLAFKPVRNNNEIIESVQQSSVQEIDFEETLLANNHDIANIKQPEVQSKEDLNVEDLVEVSTAESPEQVADIIDEQSTVDNLDNVQALPTTSEQQLARELLNIEQSAQHQAQTAELNQQIPASFDETVEYNTTINEPQNFTPPLLQDNVLEQTSVEQTSLEQVFPVSSAPLENNVLSNDESENIREQNTEQELTHLSSPMEVALATRNMLRSRKKALEEKAKTKKSNDVVSVKNDLRPKNDSAESVQAAEEKKEINVPAIESIPEQKFTPEVIDPAKIRKANQIDKWANMIDSMALGGRIRQLAIHATICESSTDDLLVLSLDQSTKHLNSDAAHKKLEQSLCEYLSRQITVELNVVEQTTADPFQIQSQINDKRYDYAKALLKEDDIIVALENDFQATLNEETIVAR